MSAIFNASAYLDATSPFSSTPAYPCLMLAKMKVTDVTNGYYVLSLSDNAGAGLDGIFLQSAGNVANDPVQVNVYANDTTAAATVDGITAGTFITVGALARSASNRSAILGTTVGTAETTARATTGLSVASIGSGRYNNNANHDAKFLGRLSEVVFASGALSGLDTNIAAILTQYVAGVAAPSISQLGPFLNAYQPLRSGLSTLIGPSWTNSGDGVTTGVLFDATDHPPIIGSGGSTVGKGMAFDFGFGF